MRNMKIIREMSQQELVEYARELGALPGETFEESATRFEQEGDEAKAELFQHMAFRWWELEGVGPGA